MARDYSKYSIEGIDGKFNKRKVVLTIVEDYVKKNNPSYEELIKVFPDDLQGSKGMIRNVATDSYDANRFFSNNQITTEVYTCVVSNQWGTENLARFIEHAATLGYNISKVYGIGSDDPVSSNYGGPTMPIPQGLFEQYKAEWGRYVVFYMENSPSLDIEKFEISLDLQDRVVLGKSR